MSAVMFFILYDVMDSSFDFEDFERNDRCNIVIEPLSLICIAFSQQRNTDEYFRHQSFSALLWLAACGVKAH